VSAIAPRTNCFALKSKPIRQGGSRPLGTQRGKGLKVQDVTRHHGRTSSSEWGAC
jgi:hypothetical protein